MCACDGKNEICKKGRKKFSLEKTKSNNFSSSHFISSCQVEEHRRKIYFNEKHAK